MKSTKTLVIIIALIVALGIVAKFSGMEMADGKCGGTGPNKEKCGPGMKCRYKNKAQKEAGEQGTCMPI